jgi:hypothetical protein
MKRSIILRADGTVDITDLDLDFLSLVRELNPDEYLRICAENELDPTEVEQ